MLLVLVPLLCFALPYLTSTCFALVSCLAWFSAAVSVCLCCCFASSRPTTRRSVQFYHCTRPVPLFLTLASACASSLFAWTGPFTSWFQISVDRSLLSHSQALHLHPFAGPDPEPKPNQTKPNQTKAHLNATPYQSAT